MQNSSFGDVNCTDQHVTTNPDPSSVAENLTQNHGVLPSEYMQTGAKTTSDSAAGSELDSPAIFNTDPNAGVSLDLPGATLCLLHGGGHKCAGPGTRAARGVSFCRIQLGHDCNEDVSCSKQQWFFYTSRFSYGFDSNSTAQKKIAKWYC